MSAAAAPADTDEEVLFDDLGNLTEQYNTHADQTPWFVADRLANERIEVIVASSDGATYRYAVQTDKDATVTDYKRGDATWKPTVRVTTDLETVRTIQNASDPGAAASAAYSRGDVSIDGVTLSKKIEIGIVKAGVAVGKFLGLV